MKLFQITGIATSLPWFCDFDDTFCDMVHIYDDDPLDPDIGEWRWERGLSRARRKGLLTGPVFDANGTDNGKQCSNCHFN